MLYTADHHVYELPPLLEWNVRHTGTVPCDSWSVTAVYRPEMAPVLKMAAGFAAVEDGQTQLRGIVDEYSVELDQNGLTVTLAGRGYAARLLDNESRPVTYERVTLRELLRRAKAALKKKTVLTALRCLEAFEKDHNLEHLVDAANYLMLRYMYPMPGERFWATTSSESVGTVGVPINMEREW